MGRYTKNDLRTRPLLIYHPPPGSGRVRKLVHNIVTKPTFELLIMFCILANVITMAMEHWAPGETPFSEGRLSTEWQLMLDIFGWVFLGIFSLEAVLKLYGLGITMYFREGWNIFDFIIVIGSWFAAVVSLVGGIEIRLTLLRVFRVARVFRLIKTKPGLKRLLVTLFFSLPSLANVGAIFFLMLFVYSVAGVNLFGSLQHGDAITGSFGANFENFPSAFMTLFRCATGESWNALMHEARAEVPYIAEFYFISFVVLGSFVLLNLLIAIILENFSNLIDAESKEGLTIQELDSFQLGWHETIEGINDPKRALLERRGCIRMKHLSDLARNLPLPLGFRGMETASEARIEMWVKQLKLPGHVLPEELKQAINQSDRVAFYVEVVLALAKSRIRSSAATTKVLLMSKEQRIIEQRLIRTMYKRNHTIAVAAKQESAAVFIQRKYRLRLLRREQRDLSSLMTNIVETKRRLSIEDRNEIEVFNVNEISTRGSVVVSGLADSGEDETTPFGDDVEMIEINFC